MKCASQETFNIRLMGCPHQVGRQTSQPLAFYLCMAPSEFIGTTANCAFTEESSTRSQEESPDSRKRHIEVNQFR